MARPEKYKVEQVIEAIRKAQTAAGAALALGCAPETIRAYARRHPTVATALDGERDNLLDYAEMGLKRAVLAGEAWAIAFALRTIGKSRGYSERHEIANATDDSGNAIPFRIVDYRAGLTETEE